MTNDLPARRLLSLLVDERDLETEPIAELRADLAVLGLDPARAIGMARRLAAGAGSPAVQLLGRIAGSEEADDEMHRLERADIGAVHRGLDQGAMAAAIATAQRAAGRDSNIVGLRRRRSRRLLYGLGGVAAALAASLVFYVGMSGDPSRQFSQSPDSAGRDFFSGGSPASTAAPSGATEATPLTDQVTSGGSTEIKSATGEQSGVQELTGGNLQALNQAAQPEAPPAILPQDAGTTAKSEADANAVEERRLATHLEGLSRLRSDVAEQQAAQGDGPSSPATAPGDTAEMNAAGDEVGKALKKDAGSLDRVAAGSAVPQPPAESEPAAMPSPDQEGLRSEEQDRSAATTASRAMSGPTAPFGLTRPVVALLIVDPKLVPANLKQEDYPTGDLLGRLADARRLAGDRLVAALVTLRMADRTADAAVVVVPEIHQYSLQGDADGRETSLPATSIAKPYDLILLDRR